MTLDAAEDGGSGGMATTSTSDESEGADDTTGPDACEWQPAPIPTGLDEEPPAECAHLVSEGEVAPVTLRITNDGSEVVHLTSPISCVAEHFALEDAEGRVFPAAHCQIPCEASLAGECGCLANCPLPPAIALHPGGVFEAEWDGFVVESREASPECAGECAGECAVRAPPAEGSMRALLALATELECGDQCECTPGDQGWCEVPGGVLGDRVIVESSVQWPTACPVIELRVP